MSEEMVEYTGPSCQFFQWRWPNGKILTVSSIAPDETVESLEASAMFARAVAAHDGVIPSRIDEDPNRV